LDSSLVKTQFLSKDFLFHRERLAMSGDIFDYHNRWRRDTGIQLVEARGVAEHLWYTRRLQRQSFNPKCPQCWGGEKPWARWPLGFYLAPKVQFFWNIFLPLSLCKCLNIDFSSEGKAIQHCSKPHIKYWNSFVPFLPACNPVRGTSSPQPWQETPWRQQSTPNALWAKEQGFCD
jgi:hypothetical protein